MISLRMQEKEPWEAESDTFFIRKFMRIQCFTNTGWLEDIYYVYGIEVCDNLLKTTGLDILPNSLS